MSTRCSIRIFRMDGTKTGIYCHHDGYVEYVGMMLQMFYNTREKVECLMAQGDMSSLMPTTEDCVTYNRWRGEQFRMSLQDEEFNYTFIEYLGVWVVSNELEYDYYENNELDLQGSYCAVKNENYLINEIDKHIDDCYGFFESYCSKYMKGIDDVVQFKKRVHECALEGRNEAKTKQKEN